MKAVGSTKRTSSTVYSAGLLLVILSPLLAFPGSTCVRHYRQETQTGTNSSVIDSDESRTQRPCATSVAPMSGDVRLASYNGVTFTYPVSLASEVNFATKPASLLAGETDKPEGVVPAHPAFTFKGSYGSRHKSSFFAPEISIYHIQQYKNALAASNSYVKSLENDIKSLKAILAERPAALEQEVPFLPFGTDATQAFVSRIRYIDFENGRGLIFLTQFNIEPSLVNNQGLTYIFQGLTDDGLYYVSARFPVTLSFLPPSYESKSFGEYAVSMFYGSDQESNQENYKVYVETMKRRLGDVSPEKFEPNLTVVENLISSLCVMPKLEAEP